MKLVFSIAAGWFFAATLSLNAAAQPDSAAANASLEAQVFGLLAHQCGSDEIEDDFVLAARALGPDAEPILLSVLENGAPRDVLGRAAQSASRYFDRRQAWLADEGDALFGDDAARLAARDRQSYVAGQVRRTDILYRENAARSLGEVGNPNSIRRLRALSQSSPALEASIEAAIAKIDQRERRPD